MQEGSLLSTPPPVFFIGRLFKDAHSDSVKWYLTVLIVEVELSPSIYLLECPFLWIQLLDTICHSFILNDITICYSFIKLLLCILYRHFPLCPYSHMPKVFPKFKSEMFENFPLSYTGQLWFLKNDFFSKTCFSGLVDTVQEEGSGMNQESSINIYTLLCVK